MPPSRRACGQLHGKGCNSSADEEGIRVPEALRLVAAGVKADAPKAPNGEEALVVDAPKSLPPVAGAPADERAEPKGLAAGVAEG
jgi:hypothetical protein